MKRKAQAAMEFLLTYGWAILVVLVVLGALAYFGVLKPQNLLPDRCGAPSGVVCQDYQLSKAGAVVVNLQNGLGRTIHLIQIDAATPEGLTCTGDLTGQTIANGDSLTLSTTSCTGDPNTLMAKVGAKQKAEYTVTYSYDATGAITHLINGDIFTSVSP